MTVFAFHVVFIRDKLIGPQSDETECLTPLAPTQREVNINYWI